MAGPRPRFLLISLLLAGSLLMSGTVVGQSPVPSSPAPINPVCDLAFRRALTERGSAAAGVETEAGGPAPSPSPGGAPPALDWLDGAIRACASLEEFAAVAALYPQALGETDVRVFVASRCWDLQAGLETYATCRSFEAAIATPTPSPIPAPTSSPTAEPTPRPTAKPTPRPTARPTPRPTAKPAPGSARVPRGFRAKVPRAGKVVYFDVRGKSINALNASAVKRAKQYCHTRSDAFACLASRGPSLRGRVNSRTGVCKVTEVIWRKPVTTAYIPRWVAPNRAPRYLVWWWKKVAARAGWHEAQHARIYWEYRQKFPRVVGINCAKAKRRVDRWWSAMARAQNDFDRLDYPRGDAASQRWLVEAISRFGR